MSPAAEPSLDPVAIASREFGTSRRGFDKDEVREYLRALSTSIRTHNPPAGDGEELRQALRDIGRLEADRDALEARLADAEKRAAAVPAEQELDEATVSQYIGKETARVLEAARTAAAEVVANAEAQADARLAEIDRVQSLANAEVAAWRKQADEEAEETRSTASAEAQALEESSAKEAAALVSDAKSASVELRQAAEEAASTMQADAEKAASELEDEAETRVAEIRRKAEAEAAASQEKVEAERAEALASVANLKAEADTDVARIRAEAEADVLSSQEAAAETARLMVVEAQAVREKVLSDLVSRRRLGRQQLDQAKAARDRLHRALVEVRKQLDEQAAELEISLPEAKAAMDAISRRAQEVDEGQQVRDLAIELDTARIVGIPLSPAEPKVSTGSAALATLDLSSDAGTKRAGADPKGVETIFARLRDDEEFGLEEAEGEETATSQDGSSVDQREAQLDSGSRDDEENDDAEAGPSDDDSVEDAIEVPQAFVQRDVAMTRFGADLRRQIKRTVADDQSDLLDRVRRAKKLSLTDLPDSNAQRAAYVEAVSSALHATAKAGSQMAGGSVRSAPVDSLVERVVASIFEPLRARIEHSVEAAEGDAEEVLEPIRAHYRDLRSIEVPVLTDDALAEAFALGAYEALADGTEMVWLADPRMEPNPDCFDNTLAGVIVKPDAFPTGRTHPHDEPGCRCLVVALPAD